MATRFDGRDALHREFPVSPCAGMTNLRRLLEQSIRSCSSFNPAAYSAAFIPGSGPLVSRVRHSSVKCSITRNWLSRKKPGCSSSRKHQKPSGHNRILSGYMGHPRTFMSQRYSATRLLSVRQRTDHLHLARTCMADLAPTGTRRLARRFGFPRTPLCADHSSLPDVNRHP